MRSGSPISRLAGDKGTIQGSDDLFKCGCTDQAVRGRVPAAGESDWCVMVGERVAAIDEERW